MKGFVEVCVLILNVLQSQRKLIYIPLLGSYKNPEQVPCLIG